MKNLIFILSAFILFSCGNNAEESTGEFKSIDSFNDTASVDEDKPDEAIMSYNNPAFIMGSDFGNFFQTMYIHNNYDDMLTFTSSESIERVGKENILNHYKNMVFGFDIGNLLSESIEDGDVVTLNYLAEIEATKVKVEIDIVVENDTCKVVLPDNLIEFPRIKKN